MRHSMKKRAYISFDYSNDKRLKDFIVKQSRLSDSPFDVIDFTEKEMTPETNLEYKAYESIRKSDVVIVMVGPKTYKTTDVLKEVALAKMTNKRLVQMIGPKIKTFRPVEDAGRLHLWNWDRLKQLLS